MVGVYSSLKSLSRGSVRDSLLRNAAQYLTQDHVTKVKEIWFNRGQYARMTHYGDMVIGLCHDKEVIELYSRADFKVLLHEVGHVVMLGERGRAISKTAQREIMFAYLEAYRSGTGFTSLYARTNHKEFFAEGYVIWCTHPDKLRVRNKHLAEIMEMVDSELEGLHQEMKATESKKSLFCKLWHRWRGTEPYVYCSTSIGDISVVGSFDENLPNLSV